MSINNFLAALALAIFGFFIQYDRLLALYGINPNIILIFLLILAFTLEDTRYFLFFLAILLATAVFLGYPWTGKIFLVFMIALAVRLFKNSLSGNAFLDFLLSIFSGTLIFYGVIGLFSRTSLPGFNPVLFETVYNILGGLLLWFIFSGLFGKAEISQK